MDMAEAEQLILLPEKNAQITHVTESDGLGHQVLGRRSRRRLTLMLVACHVVIGLQGGLRGVTMLDILERMSADTTMEHIAVAQGMQSFGVIAGSMITGPLVDRSRRLIYLFLAVALWFSAAVTFTKPWCRTAQAYGVLCFLEGVGQTAENVCSCMILLSAWGKQSDSPMQALHGGWTLGFAVCPLLVAPYLSAGLQTGTGRQELLPGDPGSLDAHVDITNQQEFVLWIPFAIISFLTVLVGMVVFGYHITGRRQTAATSSMETKPQKNWKEVFKPGSWADGDATFGAVIGVMVFLFCFTLTCRHMAMILFLVPFAVESRLAFEKQDAAFLGSVSGFALAFGRLAASVIANWIPVQTMLMVEVFLGGLAIVGIATLGTTSAAWLWILSVFFCLLDAPLWPGIYSWADKYIVMSGVLFTVMDLAAGISGFLSQWLTGYIYFHYSPEAIMTYSAIWGVALCGVAAIMQTIASRRGTRQYKS